MTAETQYTVRLADAGSRLDRFLAQEAGLSRAEAMRLIDAGQVRVNKSRGRKGALLEPGTVITLRSPPADQLKTPPQPQPKLPFHPLYVDAQVVVFNKAAGMPSHPLRAGEMNTAASALLARYPECATASETAREGGLCHRLDTHTSGALLAARTAAAWQRLRRAFTEGAVDKEYLALCVGAPPRDEGQIDLPVLPVPGHPERMRVADTPDLQYHRDALDAQTHFTVERRGGGYSLLRLSAHTGRRHQIRVHLSYLGLPLVGDVAYGGPAVPSLLPPGWQAPGEAGLPDALAGQLLHAAVLRFPHPETGAALEVVAPMPPARQALIDLLLGAQPA